MERTKNPIKMEEEKIRWKKLGGGSLHLKNRLIKPNEVFKAYPSEIPAAFRDQVIPLESIEPATTGEPITIPEPVKIAYTIQPRGKSRSLFDVVDINGKAINEKPLPKLVAEQLINDLER